MRRINGKYLHLGLIEAIHEVTGVILQKQVLIILILSSALLAVGVVAPRTASAQTLNDCFQATLETSSDKAIAVCGQVIASGTLQGLDLAIAFNNRGLGFMKNKIPDRAMSDFNEAIRISPQYPYPYDNRGDLWRDKGELDRAIADYNKAIQIDPTFSSAYLNRGITYQRMGNFRSARADYEAVLTLPDKRPIDKWAHKQARKRLSELGDAR